MNTPDATRRTFLKVVAASGGALCLELALPARAFAKDASAPAPAADGELNAWIVIHPDERVIVRIARSEMGQGSSTGLPMLVAEELQCDFANVGIEFAPVAENLRTHAWGSMSTGGSSSIRRSQDFLRAACATAREMLIAAAAKTFDVPPAECVAKNGVITHPA